MFLEPTTLASATQLLIDTLEVHYGKDGKQLMRKLEMNPELLGKSGARYPTAKMKVLWDECVALTGDSCFGLVTGSRIKATTFHALGFAWLASGTVHEELERLLRYFSVICTSPVELALEDTGDSYKLDHLWTERDINRLDPAIDAFFIAILKLIRLTAGNHFVPQEVGLRSIEEGRLAEYVAAFECPVVLGVDKEYMLFDKQACDQQLTGENHELAIANEQLLERYIQALDPDKVSSKVRELLLTLLPSGHVTQEEVAAKMNRSLSTLQRQLSAEGTNFKTLRDETRCSMAEQFIQDGEYSLSQIAFLLGFSDQSNFSRAFKRWKGVTPGDYQPGPQIGA